MGVFRIQALAGVFLLLVAACTTSVEERVVILTVLATPTPTPFPLPAHFGIRMANDSSIQNGACRISRNSSLLCWGKSVITGDGTGNTVPSFAPVVVPGFSSGVTDLSVGPSHACAIRNGDLFCWGENSTGEAGVGNLLPVTTPAPIAPPSGQVYTRVRTGARSQTCAITDAGGLYCWGNNDIGALNLGVGSVAAAVSAPTAVTDMGSDVTDVNVGAGAICAVKSGAVYCWGSNVLGELGTDTLGLPAATPMPVAGLDAGVTQVSAGDRSISGIGGGSICAIKSGALHCLGENDSYQLGDGTDQFVPSASPHPVLTSGVTSLALSGAGGCVAQSGQVSCWGKYVDSATGVVNLTGAVGPVATPAPLVGLPTGNWLSVVGNGGAFCARSEEKQEYCWGLNFDSALFTGSGTGHAPEPVEAGPFD